MIESSIIENEILGPSISVNDVSVLEGTLTILEGASGNFAAGQWHGVLGPNGGGKSTLLKTILGLTNHKGVINIEWSKKADEAKKYGTLGYLPQLTPFDGSLPISVRDYLLMSLSTKPVWFKRSLPKTVLQALAEIGLNNKLERKLGDLSGGERQRLMLCTALLKRPSLLILDEPMTGLDQQGQQDCLELLQRFKESGGTLIMVEHDWEVVEAYCDSVYWIDQTIVTQCTSQEFFAENPASSQKPRIKFPLQSV